MKGLSFLAALVMAVSILGSNAAIAKRLALVVGTSQYDSVYPLENAANDAVDMGGALTRLGFDVELVIDGTAAEFQQAVDTMAAKAGDAETILFFFSGHAFQMNGQNFLVPRDAQLSSLDVIEQQTLKLDNIVDKFEGDERQVIVLLDACRNNPLPASMQAQTGAGLAKVREGTGAFFAFATQPGAVTSDGRSEDRNSPFTAALLSHLETPGHSISDVMIDVRNDVIEASFSRQEPWDQSSLRSQFYFKPVVEKSIGVTDADLDAISQLDAASQQLILQALARNGVALEIIDVPDEEPGEAVAALVEDTGPGFTLLDVEEDEPTTTTAAAGADATASGTETVAPVGADSVSTVTGTAVATLSDGQETVIGTEIQSSSPERFTLAALEAIPAPDNLPRALQSELARIGCHRGAIDGQWGKFSRVSLLKYYAARGAVTAEQAAARDPSLDAYREAKLEPGVICTGTYAAAPKAGAKKRTKTRVAVVKTPVKPASTGTRRITTTRTKSDGTKSARPKISVGSFR
jgi:hypothetical protein